MKTLTAEEVAAKHNALIDNTPAAGHNSAGQLESYVKRFTTLAEQMDELRQDVKELGEEAKGNDLNVGAIKAIVKQQMETKEKREKRETKEAVVDTYKNALGMLD